MKTKFLFAIAFLFTACFVRAENPTKADVKLKANETNIEITIDGKPFTTYRFGADEKPPFARPFFYPVLASDGTEVTVDRTRSGGDHPHHRSFWIGHGDVFRAGDEKKGTDFWAFPKAGAEPAHQDHVKFEKVEGNGFVETLIWKDLEKKPMLNETRTVSVMAYPDGARVVDVTVQLSSATDGDVILGDTKEAGFCAIRVAEGISKKPVITNSRSGVGEKAIWGKPAEWCDESGEINGKTYGCAVFGHPSNPRFPTTWHTRAYGLLAPNEFGLSEFDKTKPKHSGDMKIAKGESVTFKYRAIFHTGNATDAKLDAKYVDFTAIK